jgi:enoyl-CoA hydratase/carnithine racemase
MTMLRTPTSFSLYDSRGFAFVEELRKLAEALHRSAEPNVKAVLLLQDADADDRCPTWLDELRDEALLHDLADRIDTVRWTLSLIRNSPVPWVYASRFDCFGSHWELASACYKRLWFAPTARVGFPEIGSGAFPPGATLESLDKRIGKVRERWRERPMLTAGDAAREGLIDFCSDARDYEAYALRFFREGLESPQWMQQRDFERKGGRQIYDFDSDLKARNATVARLAEVWKEGDEQQKSVKRSEAWDYCWQLVADRGTVRSSHERGRVISYIAAHHYLTQSFQAWLAGGVARRRFVQRFDVERAVAKPLHIDLNFREPPAEALTRLFEAGMPVVFYADDAKSLAQQLGRIFTKSGVTDDVWARQASWFQGAAKEEGGLVLRWGPGDKLLVRAGLVRLEFIRLEATETTARLGSLEWTDPPATLTGDADFGFELAKLVSNGIIRSKKIGKHALPFSMYIRALVLEEIARIGAVAVGDPTKVLEALQTHGWGFAASEDGWELFLKTRSDDHPHDPALTKPGGAPFFKPVWEARSWRELRAASRKLGGSDLETHWNPAYQSQHLAQYLGFVAFHLAPSLDAPDVADYLCARALGFPSAYGTPLTFLRMRGRRRAEWHAARQWPGLSADGLWSGQT